MKKQELAPGIVIIRDVLTADECKQMITFAEARGFDPPTINSLGVQRLHRQTRNNDRFIHDDFDLVKRLWSRVEEFVPRMLAGRPVRGLNVRFRYYRYTPGRRFTWHFDGSFARPNGGESAHLHDLSERRI
jgi:prolyl 4-hydroxylase